MSDYLTPDFVAISIEAISGVLFIVLLVRLAYLLTGGAIGGMSLEVLYIRGDDLRGPLLLATGVLTLESIEFVYPALVRGGLIQALPDYGFYLNFLQAVLLLGGVLLAYGVFGVYARRGFESALRKRIQRIAERTLVVKRRA
ncbi:MAG: hypothetical protein ACT4PT_10565 [Methanobacteriota archaeon]